MAANFLGGGSDPMDLNCAQSAMDEFYETLDQASAHARAAEMAAFEDYGTSPATDPVLTLGPDVEVQEVIAPTHGKRKQKAGQDKKTGACHRGPQFKEEEDLLIVSGWLNVATDAVVGTNQKQGSFAKRLWEYYMEGMKYQSSRTQNSIQQRWQLIKTSVSEFHAIFCALERRKESGKNEKDLIADAVRMYEQNKPWQFRHCWEVLRFEPRWDAKFQEIQAGKKGQSASEAPSDPRTRTTPIPNESIERPEGRDSAKRRRSRQYTDDASSSPAVEMLQKMHERDQQMDAKDNEHKEELMTLERTKVDIQQKQFNHQVAMEERKILLKERELDENRKLKEAAMDAKIMFTDPATMHPSLRKWIVKKQREILIKEGIDTEDLGNTSSPTDPK